MAAEIVNLNKYRKSQNRVTKERQAEVNRVRFGQSKAEKRRQEYEAQRQDRMLSGKELEDSESDRD